MASPRFMPTTSVSSRGSFRSSFRRGSLEQVVYVGLEVQLTDIVQASNFDNEVNDLVEFMRALTSDDVLRLCQTTNPQTRTAVPFK